MGSIARVNKGVGEERADYYQKLPDDEASVRLFFPLPFQIKCYRCEDSLIKAGQCHQTH